MSRTAIREVLSLAVPLLAADDMPLETTLTFYVKLDLNGPSRRLLFTTSRDAYAATTERADLVFSPAEYELLAIALADGRCTRQDAGDELRRKASDSAHRLTRPRLLGRVVEPDGGGEQWTFGELATALGAELVDVEVHDG